MMMTFNRNYFSLATLIFAVEVWIALVVRDRFVRPYLGDVLVVILLYCFIRAFFRLPVHMLALGVLALAFAMEFLQYLNIVETIGLQDSPIARTVLGTSFAWKDLLAYAAGAVAILAAEKYGLKKDLRSIPGSGKL